MQGFRREWWSVLVLCAALTPVPALAGGLDVADNGTVAIGRGGAFSAGVDDASAIYFNPAALATIDGFSLTVNGHIWLYDINFARSPFSTELIPGQETTFEFEPVENENKVFPAPMIFASHNFGLENWGFGLGVYGPPSIGATRFQGPNLSTIVAEDAEAQNANRTDGTPIVRDWGHTYLMTESEMLLIYPSLAVAHDFGPLQVGLTLQLGYLATTFTNAADGGGIFGAADDSQEAADVYTPTILDVSGVTFTGILGVRYQPVDALTLALTYRPRHTFNATGELDVRFPEALTVEVGDPPQPLASLTETGASLNQTIPDIIRFGARWAFISGGREVADIEFNMTYELWSLMEAFTIGFDGEIDVAVEAETRTLNDVVIPKGFDDTLSLRLGGDVHVTDDFDLRAGVFYEGAAGSFFDQGSIRPGYANIDFAPFQRIGLSVGASYNVADHWDIDLGYLHVFSPDYVEEDGQVPIIFPIWICEDPPTSAEDACSSRETDPRHAVNNGSYDVSYDLFSLGFTYATN